MAWILTVPELLKRAATAVENTKSDKGEALTAIIFSSAAFDGHLNEVAKLIELHLKNNPEDSSEEMKNFVNILTELEASHAQTDLKVQVAAALLGSKRWNKGTQPLQDLLLLSRLRNAILHPKPVGFPEAKDFAETNPDKLVKRLVSRGVIKEVPKTPVVPSEGMATDESFANWFIVIQTQEVASWAFTIANLGIASFVESLPLDTKARKYVEHVIRTAYGLKWST